MTQTSKRVKRGMVPLVALIAVVVVLLVGFGDRSVTSLESSYPADPATEVREDIAASANFFADDTAHTVELLVSDDDVEGVISDYRERGEKTWIRTTAIIDGTRIDDVGIRLKGNATLDALLGPPAPDEIDDLVPLSPVELPWLVRLDRYVPARRYAGIASFSIRGFSWESPVDLNEVATQNLLAAVGEPNQRAGFALVGLGGEPKSLRVVVENPDPFYADELFDGPGVLYRARSDGQFVYVGEKSGLYEQSFEQVNRVGQLDLEPLIRFAEFVDTAPDETFANDLATYLDVEGLATHMAVHNLLTNTDALGGPGQNYLLYFDIEKRQFSVVSWDVNLAMRGPADLSRDPLLVALGSDPVTLLRSNPLADRFIGVPAFWELYQQRHSELSAELIENGGAIGEVRRLEQVVAEQYGIDASVDANELEAFLVERLLYLNSTSDGG